MIKDEAYLHLIGLIAILPDSFRTWKYFRKSVKTHKRRTPKHLIGLADSQMPLTDRKKRDIFLISVREKVYLPNKLCFFLNRTCRTHFNSTTTLQIITPKHQKKFNRKVQRFLRSVSDMVDTDRHRTGSNIGQGPVYKGPPMVYAGLRRSASTGKDC